MNIALELQRQDYYTAEQTAIIGEWLNRCADGRKTKSDLEKIILEMIEVDYNEFDKICTLAVAEYNRRLTFKRLNLGLTEFQRYYREKSVYANRNRVY
jgi:hypothetical protein